MRIEVVISAVSPPVSWGSVKSALGFGDDSRQADVEAMIAGAVASLAAPKGTLGQSIGQQTLRLWLGGFGDGSVRLPYGPVSDVTKVECRNTDTGAWVEVDAATYERAGDMLVLGFGKAWPAVPASSETVRVTYVAGETQVDPAIRSAVLLMVRDELDGTPEASAESVERLLAGKQVYFV